MRPYGAKLQIQMDKTNKEAAHCGQDGSRKHDHHRMAEGQDTHEHRDLFTREGETPAVYSRSFRLESLEPVASEELRDFLVDFVQCLNRWAVEKKIYVAHVKIFAETDDGFSLWLSTTGKRVNVKAGGSIADEKERRLSLHLAAIVFGVNERVLEKVCLRLLSDSTRFRSVAEELP